VIKLKILESTITNHNYTDEEIKSGLNSRVFAPFGSELLFLFVIPRPED
jgi:hypothetical protein